MADDADNNEDNWLYGSNPDSTTNEDEDKNGALLNRFLEDQEKPQQKENENQLPDSNSNVNEGEDDHQSDHDEHDPTDDFEEDPAHHMEEGEVNLKSDDQAKDPGDSDDDDSDDDINVVIGDIKSAPTTGTYNIKQRQLPAGGTTAADKKQTQGKFNIEEFESVGTINGIPAQEYSMENLEEKPWRKPGADITDYFNYGFNEDTWRAYCERQKKYRLNESGVGLSSLSAPIQSNATALPMQHQQQNMNNMPPMIRTLTPLNNGNANLMKRTAPPGNLAKENVIQVMTAECREYSRPGGPLGPPGMGPPGEFFDEHVYDYGYEPTQDSQWMNDNPNSNPNWVPTGIKELTPGQGPPAQLNMPPPMRPPMGMGHPIPMGPHPVMHPPPGPMPPHQRDERESRPERERERDREYERRDRDRDRDYERRDRERDRDYDRRDRDRDRDRRERDRDEDEEREKRRREREREREERESSRRRERSRSRDRERRRRSRSKDRERSDRDSDRKSSRDTREKKKSSDPKPSSSSSSTRNKDKPEIKEEPVD